MHIDEDDKWFLGSVESKMRNCRLNQARKISALQWENRKDSEAPNCLPDKLGCLHCWRFVRTNLTGICEKWYRQGTCTSAAFTQGASGHRLLLWSRSLPYSIPVADTSLLYHSEQANGHFCYLRCTDTNLNPEAICVLGGTSNDLCSLWPDARTKKQWEKSTIFFSFCQVNIFKLWSFNFLPCQRPLHSIWLIKHFFIYFFHLLLFVWPPYSRDLLKVSEVIHLSHPQWQVLGYL